MTAASVRPVASPRDWGQFRALVVEYSEWLGVDLRFQGFDDELARISQHYGPPGGAALLAEPEGSDEAVGCVGVHAFDEPGVCEMKRMYVRDTARGLGLGHALAEHALEAARGLGYHTIRLDTLSRLHPAVHVYESLGFREIPPYRENPLPGVRFFELDL